MTEQLLKISTKGCKNHETRKITSGTSNQVSSRKQLRKVDSPIRLPSALELSQDAGSPNTWICKNSACRAILTSDDTFCKRCSCCICHLFDDNKDPSLWLVCTSETNERDSCGLSCHIECALHRQKVGVVNLGQLMQLDGSYCCASCGKVSGIIGCWKKQLIIAKDARRVDVLCYRISLSYRLLDGTSRFKELHDIVGDAKAKLETEVGPVNGFSAKMARGIVSRLSVAGDVQKLCSVAIEKADTWLSDPSHTNPNLREDSLPAACRIQFEDATSSSLVIVLKDTCLVSTDNIKGYKLWYCKSREGPYSKEPISVFLKTQRRILISNLQPCTEYTFRIISFTETGDLGHSEAKCFTKSVEIIHKNADTSMAADHKNENFGVEGSSSSAKSEPKISTVGSSGFKVRDLGKILRLAWAQEQGCSDGFCSEDVEECCGGNVAIRPETVEDQPPSLPRGLDLNVESVPDLNAEVTPLESSRDEDIGCSSERVIAKTNTPVTSPTKAKVSEAMSSWRALLLRIGDQCPEYGGISDFKEHIELCYGVILRELEHYGDDVLAFLLQCAEQVPHKIPLYGAVVGLLNLENEDFTKKVVDTTQNNLQDALYMDNCDKIRILMRFVTVLMCSKVLQPGSVVVAFETLLSSAATTVDEEAGNPSWQARADFYITCILACLPWGGAELFEQVPEEIERVMAAVEAYLRIRKQDYGVGLTVLEHDKAHAEKDFLEDLWDRIQVLSNNGWKVDSVLKPHLLFEAQLVDGKSHEFGPITCPEQPEPPSSLSGITIGKQKHDAELKYPRRLRRLNIFPASKAENMQPIDRFVVEEYLLDVLLYLNGCRKECASYMVGLPVPFRYEYLMAETIFSQLLLLPQPPFKPIYYTLVIIDLCKALPGAFPAVVAGAVRSLFEKIADLDMECRTRLILWFSHHLANFQFIWPWEEWAYVLELPKWAPQRVFVQEVLEREVRLSYWDKIKQSIENAPSLEELLPPKVGPSFKYSAEEGRETIEHTLFTELNGMVKGKKTAREIISWIEESVIPLHGSKIALEVIIQTLLHIGSKSFTHLMTVLERYGQVIARLCPDLDKQVALIDEVSSFWKNSAQMTAVAIDRMMGYRLISNLAIVNWVFSPANIEQFHTTDRLWEILQNAVNKTYNRISDLRKEISSLEKSVVLAQNSYVKAKAELDAAESKLEIVDGEPVQAEKPVRLKRLKAFADRAKEEEISIQESLEAKEALLARAHNENEALFVSLYKRLADVIMERLSHVSPNGEVLGLGSGSTDAMAVDADEPSAMDAEKENGHEKSQSNGESGRSGYNTGEQEQWCCTTLGYVKAFSRQYASEIWPHFEKLDAEVFVEDMHPLFRKAVYSGLRRPIDL